MTDDVARRAYPEKVLRYLTYDYDFAVRGQCRGTDPELFFPDHPGGNKDSALEARAMIAEEAERLCAGCPVIRDCARFAYKARVSGIWGGVYLPDPAASSRNAWDNAREKLATVAGVEVSAA